MSDTSELAAFEYDFFVAHPGPAMDTAESLYKRLHNVEGARAFLDKASIGEGTSWAGELESALRNSRIAVLLLTPGVDSAFYVNEEILRAIAYYRESGTPLIVPVYLEGTAPGPDSPYGLYGLQSIVSPADDLDLIAHRLLDMLQAHRAEHPMPTVQEASGPQELVVEPRGGHNTVPTLRRALAKAGPGTTIYIKPGLYEETLTITQPVNLVGAGPVDEVILQSFNATTITFAASGGRVSGITVRQQGGTFPYQAIDVSAGMPEIEGCVVVGGTRSAVRVRGTSTPTIKNNEISGTSSIGIEVGDFASPTLSGNRIRSLAETGIWVGGRAHPRIEDNLIANCVVRGMWVGDESRVVMRSNVVQECGEGVAVADTAYATIIGNTVTASRRSALTFTDEADGVVTENVLDGSGGAQVQLATAGAPAFDFNTIERGRANGVAIDVSGAEASTFTHNRISENQWSGAFVTDGANATFRENLFLQNRDNGITLHHGAGGLYESNIISDNGQNGVSLYEADAPQFVLNLIRNNGWSGIFVLKTSARCDRNHVYDNPGSAVTIASGGAPRLKENDLSARDNAAVVAFDSNDTSISLNYIHDSKIGIDVRAGSLKVDVNNIDSNGVGVKAAPGVKATLGLNSFGGNVTAIEDATGELPGTEEEQVQLDEETSARRIPGFVAYLAKLESTHWGAPNGR